MDQLRKESDKAASERVRKELQEAVESAAKAKGAEASSLRKVKELEEKIEAVSTKPLPL